MQPPTQPQPVTIEDLDELTQEELFARNRQLRDEELRALIDDHKDLQPPSESEAHKAAQGATE